MPKGSIGEKLKCSICGSKHAERYPISEKEVRILCVSCVQKNLNKDNIESVSFVKASRMYHGSV